MAWVAVGVAGATLVTGYMASESASDSADKAFDQADRAAQLQFDISQQQMDLANEQWGLYKDNIFPLEQEAQQLGLDYQKLSFEQYEDYYKPLGDQFAQDAMEGIEADPERAAREARLSVDQQFDTEEGMMQRNLERRGVRPGSGNYESGIADTSLSRAAAKGFTVNRAVEAERDRVEDVNFNRKAVALGRSPMIGGSAPGLSSAAGAYGMAQAGNTAQGAGSQFSNLGNQYGNAAANTMSGVVQVGAQAYDLYNKYNTPAAPPASSYNMNNMSSTNTGYAPGSDAEFAAFKDGGPVNAPPALQRGGYAGGGEVNGQPGVDKINTYIEGPDGSRTPAKISDGEYIIDSDTVRAVGTDALDDIVRQAREKKQKAAQGPNALTRRMS